MKYKLITLWLIIFMGTSVFVSGGKITYTNYKLDSTIIIDGEMLDWINIEPVSINLKPAWVINEGNASFTADFYSTHDALKIYFLIVIKGDVYQFYDINTCDSGRCLHRGAPALAMAFPIDDGAKVEYMGGSGRGTYDEIENPTGEVDILHWELDTNHGIVAGGSKNTTEGARFGDGIGNMDDEWAITAIDRHDDNDPNSENSYRGAWGFTGGYNVNGTAGDWIFEISRDLQTGDPHDAQFAEGQTIDVAIAFWTPNEHTNKKWSDDGHYVNYDNVILMAIDSATGPPLYSSTSDDPTSSTSSTYSTSGDDVSSTFSISKSNRDETSSSAPPNPLGFNFLIFQVIFTLVTINIIIKKRKSIN